MIFPRTVAIVFSQRDVAEVARLSHPGSLVVQVMFSDDLPWHEGLLKSRIESAVYTAITEWKRKHEAAQ